MDASKQVDMELQVGQFKEEAREELLAMKEVLVKKQADFKQAIRAKGEKLEEATARLQLVEAELFNLRELQKESSSQGRVELLAMKEALAKKQADFEKELDTKDERLAEATTRLRLAEAELLSLQELQSKPCNKDLVQLKDVKRQLQDTLKQWKDDMTTHDNQFIEYEKNITEQIEVKNGQTEDLQSTLKQVQESSELTHYRAVEAERQK